MCLYVCVPICVYLRPSARRQMHFFVSFWTSRQSGECNTNGVPQHSRLAIATKIDSPLLAPPTENISISITTVEHDKDYGTNRRPPASVCEHTHRDPINVSVLSISSICSYLDHVLNTFFNSTVCVIHVCWSIIYILDPDNVYIWINHVHTTGLTQFQYHPPRVCVSPVVLDTHTHVCLYRLTMIFLYSGRERERNTLTGTYFQRPLHSGIDRLHGAGRSSNRRCSDAWHS